MKQIIALTLFAALAAIVSTGCSTSRAATKRTTPIAVSGPVTVSGPVNVTGPITITGTTGTAETVKAVPAAPAARVVPAAAIAAPAATTSTVADGTEIELKKEDLSVQRGVTSNGKVVIRKTVVSETANIPVTLTREEFVVERVAADGQPTTPWGEAVNEISMPLTRETAAPVITPRVIERVRVRKTVSQDPANVTGTVRTEKLDVVKQ